MKIINSVLGDATGGRWQVVVDYAEILTELGHQVILVAERSKVSDSTKLPANVELVTLRNSGHYDLAATLNAWRLVRRFRPELVIAHCSRSVALFKRAARSQARVVGVSHSNNVKRMARADAFFNISSHIGREMVRFGAGGKPAFHIPNMGNFDPNVQFAPRRWQQPPLIGAIGRLDPVKGFHVLVEALGLLKQRGVEFRTALAGDGYQRSELEQRIAELELQDRFELRGWTDDPNGFLSEVDLVCIPALSDAFGLTPLDAAATSTPQVLSTAFGHLDMFEDGVSALYAEKGNAEALADALQRALQDEAAMQAMAEKAFERVTDCYTRAKLVERLSAAVDNLSSAS
ncbi:glycosyltransferase family 4 protein [Marinobacterium arenosum]|uniref:glycosyltransferase family 4 protein n=1 Tax=Marinobacterium arenosum TaxID=2862496 RepID=UPI001C98982A|nr:glycosyltransferase family 4 protein [Marinobacterium arenosum]MBY4676436.1 glycosyltransferase family 4 protein [Marinobacterium arenosum]